MASSKDYMDFILEQLSELDEITYRARVYSKRQIQVCRDESKFISMAYSLHNVIARKIVHNSMLEKNEKNDSLAHWKSFLDSQENLNKSKLYLMDVTKHKL